jgi:GNAT superfamily N-acetyltransferase
MSNPAATPITISLATPADIPYIPFLESASDQLFRTISMSSISDGDPMSIDYYAQYQASGHLWVATPTPSPNETNTPLSTTTPPIAFIQIKVYVNDNVLQSVFIHQVSVDPLYARQGIGKRLFEFVESWAKEGGYGALDLTTFDDVPWNRGYYERLGFKVLQREDIEKDDAKDVRERLKLEQKDKNLEKWTRVAMRKVLQ